MIRNFGFQRVPLFLGTAEVYVGERFVRIKCIRLNVLQVRGNIYGLERRAVLKCILSDGFHGFGDEDSGDLFVCRECALADGGHGLGNRLIFSAFAAGINAQRLAVFRIDDAVGGFIGLVFFRDRESGQTVVAGKCVVYDLRHSLRDRDRLQRAAFERLVLNRLKTFGQLDARKGGAVLKGTCVQRFNRSGDLHRFELSAFLECRQTDLGYRRRNFKGSGRICKLIERKLADIRHIVRNIDQGDAVTHAVERRGGHGAVIRHLALAEDVQGAVAAESPAGEARLSAVAAVGDIIIYRIDHIERVDRERFVSLLCAAEEQICFLFSDRLKRLQRLQRFFADHFAGQRSAGQRFLDRFCTERGLGDFRDRCGQADNAQIFQTGER